LCLIGDAFMNVLTFLIAGHGCARSPN
jgi:hypothetical protein